MPILNYTTKIDSYKTITEIQQCLSKAGANKIIIDNKKGIPNALTFCIEWKGSPIFFALPCNFEGVKRSMSKSPKVPRSMCTEEQALRVSWRILKVWIEAQLAIVESEMVDMAEVFLPYAITKSGDTLYKYLENNNTLLLSENN